MKDPKNKYWFYGHFGPFEIDENGKAKGYGPITNYDRILVDFFVVYLTIRNRLGLVAILRV